MIYHRDTEGTEKKKLKNANCKLNDANGGIGNLQFALFILQFAIDSYSVLSVSLW
jgi:hypothetical protein